jgi:hypothetical protein
LWSLYVPIFHYVIFEFYIFQSKFLDKLHHCLKLFAHLFHFTFQNIIFIFIFIFNIFNFVYRFKLILLNLPKNICSIWGLWMRLIFLKNFSTIIWRLTIRIYILNILFMGNAFWAWAYLLRFFILRILGY